MNTKAVAIQCWQIVNNEILHMSQLLSKMDILGANEQCE